MNRRNALKAAIGGLAAAVWPWKTQAAQPVKIRFKNTFWTRVKNVGWSPVRRDYEAYTVKEVEPFELGCMTWKPGELLRLPNGNYWRSVICTGFTKGGKHYKLPEHERLYCEMRANCESLRRAIRESDAWELEYMEAAQPRRDGTRWTKEDLLMMPRGS